METLLTMATVSSNVGGGSRFHKTKLAHVLMETRSLAENKRTSFSAVAERQDSEGAVLMDEGVAMWGTATPSRCTSTTTTKGVTCGW